ncbi:MAG: hypothetical protein U1E23_04345 [Reyranellaceae bacterium]
MPRKIQELTQSETKAVIGGARLPLAVPFQTRLPRPAATPS